MLDHAKKLEFVHKMAKLGLQHFDSGGGVISAGNSNPLSGVAGALTAQNSFQAGAPTSADTVGSQQATLASQLQNEAAGNGPNPAQIQYQQNSQKISQQQAATNAQNRALNPAAAARMSGNAAVQSGQNAAATAGAQQAEQQLAAQQQMAGLTGQEQTGDLAAQAINAQTSQNNTNAVNQTQGGILGGIGKSLPFLGGFFGGAKGGLAESLTPVSVGSGGKVSPNKYAVGGSIHSEYAPNFSNADVIAQQEKDKSQKSPVPQSGPQSGAGQLLSATPENNFGASNFFSGSAPELGASEGIGGSAAAPSLTEIAPLAVAAARGGLMKSGGNVVASNNKEKAVVNKDSYQNDKIPALLSQGEFVIDKDTMNDKGPMGQMARALAKHIQARNGKKK